MINKNNINDIRVISLASQYITAKWIIIATITINIILATIITFTIKNTKTSKNRSIRYNEIKSINSVMLRKNKKENHIRRVDKKYSKLKDISFNNKKVYIYIGCSLIILGVSVKLLLNFYNNYIIKIHHLGILLAQELLKINILTMKQKHIQQKIVDIHLIFTIRVENKKYH